MNNLLNQEISVLLNHNNHEQNSPYLNNFTLKNKRIMIQFCVDLCYFFIDDFNKTSSPLTR